jgi:cell wall-associated NlpC family hydrolase
MASHWSDPYLGAPYSPGEGDCVGFALRATLEVFGREISIARPEGEPDYRALARAVEQGRNELAAPTDAPVEGDIVLMRGRGYINHVGLYALLAGEPWVVHSFIRCGAVARHRIRQLSSYGLAVEGYYKWI